MKLKGFKKSDGSIAKIYTDPTLTESDSPADAASVKAKDDLLQQGITNNANYAAGLNTRLSELENGAPSIIAPKVTEWLEDNVNPVGSAVTVDSSLTVAGSAADAKKTGDEIGNLKSDLSEVYRTTTISRGTAGSAGGDFVVNNGDVLKITNNSTAGLTVRLRETSSGENLQTISVLANTTVYVPATTNAGYISIYFNASGNAVVEAGKLISVDNDIYNNGLIVDELSDKIVIERSNAGAKGVEHTVNVGDVFRITNTSASGITIRFRETSSSSENLQVAGVQANSIGYITATTSAGYIQIYFNASGSAIIDFGRLANVESVASNAFDNSVSQLDLLVLEQGKITQAGQFLDDTTRLRTKNYLTGTFTVKAPDNYVVYYAFYFDSLGYYNTYTQINAQVATITVPQGLQCKLVIANKDLTSDVSVKDVKASLVIEDFDSRIDKLENTPLVQFTYDHELDSNVATIVSEKEYTTSPTSMEDIYSYFDALMGDGYVTKVDLATELSVTYPRYANGISSGDTDYLETPAYKTYMYKLIDYNSNINAGQPKKKVIILGGVHGDEQAAPFNLYLFAQKLCNDYLTDDNVFKLRSAFDFYIVPCVNGYGMIHQWRLNGNGVNINRNFPVEKWVKTGSKGEDNYTGETAGSEFETQLIMELVDSVKPDMFVDHHNFTYNLNTQFYTDIWNTKQLKLVYQALADVSYTLKKGYPTYFGTGFDFVKNNGGCPATIGETYGGTARWAFEQFIPLSTTIEIGDCITYSNGTHAGSRVDYFGADTFTVGEYSLRNQVLHYGQWVLENA